MRVRPIFAWYDLWVGVFYDRPKRRLYVLPLPCIGFVISLDRGRTTEGVAMTKRSPQMPDPFNEIKMHMANTRAEYPGLRSERIRWLIAEIETLRERLSPTKVN